MSAPEFEGIEENTVTGAVAGERLRLAREGLKLSVKDIAEKIRIDIHKVEALESGDVDTIGAPVFAAGYIRAYARIVSLPANELIAEYEGIEHISSTSTHSISANNPADLGRMNSGLPAAFSIASHRRGKKSFVRWIVIGLLLIVIAAAMLWFMKSGGLSTLETKTIHSDSISLPNNAPLENETDGQRMLTIPEQDTSVSVLEINVVSDESSASSGSNVQDESPVIQSEEIDNSSEAVSPDELVLQFQDDSWVEVNDAQNDRLIHQLAHAGQIHTLHGVAPFSLVLGYVPGVSILLNGESVDLSKYQGRRLAHITVGKDASNEN